MERKKLELMMSVILILCACILAGRGWEKAASSQVRAEEKRWTVVIDAGHGGTFGRPKDKRISQLFFTCKVVLDMLK